MTGGSAEGRARVRAELIQPLEDMGMARKRGHSIEQHNAMMARLADKLSYMTEENLRGLRDWVIRIAAGKARDTWPREVSILSAAWNIQTPPPRESDYALSIIRSVMGIRAHEGGYLVELFQIAKKIGPPPNRYVLAKLRDQARDNRARRDRIKEYIATGRVTPEDMAWFDRYHDDLALCMAIIEDKGQAA